MKETRSIRAKEIIEDIRSGVSDEDLMQKYNLSPKSLNKVFTKLLDAQALQPEDFYFRGSYMDEQTGDLREMMRSYSVFSIPVYDTEDLELEGWIVDITERGLQIAGIAAQIGESRTLLIRADEFSDIYPFAFDAVCRWVHAGNDQSEPSVGFEITDMSETGLMELRKLIQLLTIN
jgi:hypothetical protein